MRATLSAMLAAQLLFAAAAFNDRACNFTLESLEFDLCPLFSGQSTSVAFGEETPPTFTTHRYAVNFGAPLKLDTTLPRELQVNENSVVTLVVITSA